MGIEFTKDQQKVIDLRDRNILVSAAAGSGKTAVLVERIITRLTKDEVPLDVDRLLIVTYTEAAAAEMKERIHAAIEKALDDNPENVHLERQTSLIHHAQITTIHQFCLSVMRDYFHTIDLDPGFRVGEDGELKLLKKDVIEEVLEQAYLAGKSEFVDFVECFASGKDDANLEELILQLYEFSGSYPNPKRWLENCVGQYDISSVDELEAKPFIADILSEVHLYLEDIRDLLAYALQICEEPDGPGEYTSTIGSDLEQVERLCTAHTFSQMQKAVQNAQWVKLKPCKASTVCLKKKEQVQNARSAAKELLKEIKELYFSEEISKMQVDMLATKEHMQTLCDLVIAFADAFREAKKQKNLIDFSDMEQYALQILTKEENGVFVPSDVAKSYQQKFEEVMIDEYQDSNYVQEAILTAVSRVSEGQYNIFMVGDVKQSIYRFRLSRPELFMEKYNTYSIEESQTQRIDLHKNFRSRREVLDSTNFIFEQIMISAFGGIAYDEKAALHVGAEYEHKEGNETELLLIDASGMKAAEQREIEAEAVARRIKELVETQEVLDKRTGAYRRAKYSDIVILSRSVLGWADTFSEVLKRAGIPVYVSSRDGYFQTQEIQLILNYLRILDNPRQDIPFTSILTSAIVGVSTEELAQIKNATEEQTIYERVCKYMEVGTDVNLQTRLRDFLCMFERFRERVPYTAIHTLLWKLLEETGYGDYVAALPGGAQRTANLEMLVEKAVNFEGTSYKGLFNFVRYIEQLQKYAVDYGEASVVEDNADAVNLMSIHKSKGLEFPIVFVVGMNKKFNLKDTVRKIVVHPELGVGIERIDSQLRTKKQTILKSAIGQKVRKESAAEELRVLYVAMTRAKEKLILTGSVTGLEKMLQGLEALGSHREVQLPYRSLTKASTYLEWILSALYRNQCLVDLLNQYDIEPPYDCPLYEKSVPINVYTTSVEELACKEVEEAYAHRITKEILNKLDVTKTYDENMRAQIEEQFSYTYPYKNSANVKQKMSVSELKKRTYMEEGGEEIFKEEEVIPLLPKFLQDKEEMTGASRGTAYHKVLELLDFTRDYTEEELQKEVETLAGDMSSCVREQDIRAFLSSSIGKRVQAASRLGRYYAEQPFVLGVPADEVYSEAGKEEYLVIQGVIDVYFEEEDGLVVLDYKTDRVSRAKELTERYHAQLDYYARALERLTGKKVKEKIIYSFALHQEIVL